MRADRLLSLLMLLQTRGRMSARQLARELEVCERTIYRDVVALNTAGVPVYGEAGAEGGYQLVDSYRTSLTGLSDSEAHALMMLNIPGLLSMFGFNQEVKAAMLKLSAALPVSHRQDEERVRQRYVIDSNWMSQADGALPHLQTIQQAIWEDRKLFIAYIPLFDVRVERLVDPLGLAARAGLWYLVYAHNQRVRAVRVSGLLDARIDSDSFNRPADFDLPAFWRNWCLEEEQRYDRYPVSVRVRRKALPDVIRRFGTQARQQFEAAPANQDGSRVIQLTFRGIDEARDRLIQCGSGIEVLEPFALRASIADMAAQTARLYQE